MRVREPRLVVHPPELMCLASSGLLSQSHGKPGPPWREPRWWATHARQPSRAQRWQIASRENPRGAESGHTRSRVRPHAPVCRDRGNRKQETSRLSAFGLRIVHIDHASRSGIHLLTQQHQQTFLTTFRSEFFRHEKRGFLDSCVLSRVNPFFSHILTGVLVHRVTRPLRGSVSCGSGWSVQYCTVPCVSIQLTV